MGAHDIQMPNLGSIVIRIDKFLEIYIEKELSGHQFKQMNKESACVHELVDVMACMDACESVLFPHLPID